MESTSAASAEPNARNEARSRLHQLLVTNESGFFWLFCAASLIFVANWFFGTHGYFQFNDARLNVLLHAVSIFSPVIGVLLLFSDDCRDSVPYLAIGSFISILMLWPSAAICCFIVLLCCWTKTTRWIGLALLVLVQLFSATFFYVTGESKGRHLEEFSRLDIPGHTIVLSGLPEPGGNYFSQLLVQGVHQVVPGFSLVKTYYRLDDQGYMYKKDLFSLAPVDDNHVCLVGQIGPRSHRKEIDLTIKNQWVESFD
jgi:hypothetical protein